MKPVVYFFGNAGYYTPFFSQLQQHLFLFLMTVYLHHCVFINAHSLPNDIKLVQKCGLGETNDLIKTLTEP